MGSLTEQKLRTHVQKLITLSPHRSLQQIQQILKLGNRQIIKEEDKVKLLGIAIDNQLKCDNHIKNMSKEAGKKINALARIAPYLNENKWKLLMKTFVLTFFNYCLLVWMYCSRKNNKLINTIHERALRIAYNDFSSNFEQLLLKDNTVTNHTRNLKQLATEIYKTIHHENPSFMEEIFRINESPYGLRRVTFTRNKPNTNLVPRVSLLPYLYSGIQEAVRQSDWLFAILRRYSVLGRVNSRGM